MELIANLWWVWLLGAIGSYAILIFSQLNYVKKYLSVPLHTKIFQSFISIFIFGLLGSGFVIMLLFSTILNLIIFIKG